MAINGVSEILAGGLNFTPWIEEAAIRYTERNYVMASRVKTFRDMTGWNVRKVTEYLKGRRANQLSEDTDIPDTKLLRARKAQIEPLEWGDRYRVSDRRADTDLENILADVVEALGKSLGDQKEAALVAAAQANFIGGALGSSVTAYSINLPISAQYEFRNRARKGQLFHVIHPFQARDVMQALVTFNGATPGVDLDFRNQAIAGWNIPSFEGLNIAVSDFMPRSIVFNVPVYGTGGTFRLAVYDGETIGENVTAAITVSATPATTVANIKAALEALTFVGNGTWTVTGASNAAIVVTPPAAVRFDVDSELRIAVDPADPHVEGYKSAYDLVTGISGSTTDRNGDSYGVRVTEKSATCKSLLFYRDALVQDIRKSVSAFYETVHQGRTGEYSAYETYGVGGWQTELGMTIETTCNSAFATG